mmetsp:Transcript_58871/g.140438  ORF Transcript_58871/g.140438 Transcript_58871/m.140438 type:complete len:237 (+) Transcript_58871:115-825(+)
MQIVRSLCGLFGLVTGSRRAVSGTKGCSTTTSAAAQSAQENVAAATSSSTRVPTDPSPEKVSAATNQIAGVTSQQITEPPSSKLLTQVSNSSNIELRFPDQSQQNWHVQRAAWLRKSVEEVMAPRAIGVTLSSSTVDTHNPHESSAPRGGSFGSIGSQGDKKFRSKDSELSWQLQACLVAIEEPFPVLKTPVPLSTTIAQAVSIWAIDSHSETDEEEKLDFDNEAPPDLSADFVMG